MQNNQRRLVNIVRDFLERAILPEIRRNEPLAASCQYFTTLLTQDPVDFNGLQAIVDTFPTNRVPQPVQQPKSPAVFTKRKDQVPNSYQFTSQTSNGFNPSRTFGGQRNRYNMFQPKRQQQNIQPTPNGNEYKVPLQAPLQSQPSKSLASMENIYRVFLENQQKLQQIAQQQTLNTYAPRGVVANQDRQYY